MYKKSTRYKCCGRELVDYRDTEHWQRNRSAKELAHLEDLYLSLVQTHWEGCITEDTFCGATDNAENTYLFICRKCAVENGFRW